MKDYTIIVRYTPTDTFDKGVIIFNERAFSMVQATQQVKKHPFYPKDGIITSFKENKEKRKWKNTLTY